MAKSRLARTILMSALTALLVIATLSGCAQPTATTAPTPTGSADPLAEHMSISVALWGIGSYLPDKTIDSVRDKFYSDLNIDIVPVNTTWDDYTTKIQIWAASKQLPDVFAIDAVNTDYLTQWITDGVVKTLPSDYSAYPDLAKIMDDPSNALYKYPLGADGKWYSIPRPNYMDGGWSTNDYAVVLRKDWIANLGKSVPTTFAEFQDLMVAFATGDPDKNGINGDTIGLTTYDASWLGVLFNSFEPGLTGGDGTVWVKDATGANKWIPAFMTQGAKDGFAAVKALYDAGGLDKDFATIKGTEGEDKFLNGQAGALAHGGNPGGLYGMRTKFDTLFPGKSWDDVFTIMYPFKNYQDGKYYRYVANSCWSESYLNSEVSDAKMDRVLRMFDYMFSDKGNKLFRYGIEGVNYTVAGDGTVTLIPIKDGAGNVIPISKVYPITPMSSLAQWSGTGSYIGPFVYPDIQAQSKAVLDWWMSNSEPMATDLRMGFLAYDSKTKNNEVFKDDLVKLVLSSDLNAAYTQMIADYKAGGYDTVISEANAAAAAAGIQ